jgi:thymidylate kinase
VSFSGIDGAGKSTQIRSLCNFLTAAGFRVRLLVFWEDVATLARLREFISHAAFKGDRGIGSPAKPLNRRDKNVRSWYMTAFRFLLYFLDAVWLTLLVAKIRGDAEVAIFDRYIYDELANLELNNSMTRAYVRLLLRFVPTPDIAYLLDADPVRARERKPEYPLEFLKSNRASYLALNELTGAMTVIGPLSRSEVEQAVLRETLKKLPPALHASPSRPFSGTLANNEPVRPSDSGNSVCRLPSHTACTGRMTMSTHTDPGRALPKPNYPGASDVVHRH